jgi:hypothetical protein
MGVWVVFGTALEGRSLVALVGMHTVLVMTADVVGQILTGLVVLAMVQFICYVVEEDSEPRWLLRNAHIILCLLAFSLLLNTGLRSWPQGWINLELIFGRSPDQMVSMDRRLGVAWMQFELLLPVFTKVLCVLGIAAILRTVLPVLAESKTLA